MDDEDAIETWLDMLEKYSPIPSFCRTRMEKEIPQWIKSLDEVDTETTRKGKELLKKWEALLPDLVQLARFNYFNRPDWVDETQVKRIVKFLWVNTFHQIRIYIESKKVEEQAMSHAVQVIGNRHSVTNLVEHISILYAGSSFAFNFLQVDPPSPINLLDAPDSTPPSTIPASLPSTIPASLPSTIPASPTEESFESVD